MKCSFKLCPTHGRSSLNPAFTCRKSLRGIWAALLCLHHREISQIHCCAHSGGRFQDLVHTIVSTVRSYIFLQPPSISS